MDTGWSVFSFSLFIFPLKKNKKSVHSKGVEMFEICYRLWLKFDVRRTATGMPAHASRMAWFG
jgi:hypothetical protein